MTQQGDNQGPVVGQLPASVPVWYTMLVSLIKDLGFPVVMAGALLWLSTVKIDALIVACTNGPK